MEPSVQFFERDLPWSDLPYDRMGLQAQPWCRDRRKRLALF